MTERTGFVTAIAAAVAGVVLLVPGVVSLIDGAWLAGGAVLAWGLRRLGLL